MGTSERENLKFGERGSFGKRELLNVGTSELEVPEKWKLRNMGT